MPKNILAISYDEHLMLTRKLLFEREGYQVVSVLGYVDARSACQAGGSDLAFIGHSVPKRDRDALIREFRDHNQAPVIVTSMGVAEERRTEGVRIIHTWEGPKAVLDAAKELLRTTASDNPAGS
jgi:DNA-binding response OmpR family regulator